MANPLHTKVTPKATHGENNIKDLQIPSLTLQQYSVKQEQEDEVLQIDL